MLCNRVNSSSTSNNSLFGIQLKVGIDEGGDVSFILHPKKRVITTLITCSFFCFQLTVFGLIWLNLAYIKSAQK